MKCMFKSIISPVILHNPVPALNTGEECYIYWYQSYGLVDSRTNVTRFTQYIRTNLAAQQPPTPSNPQLVPVAPQGVEVLRLNKPPVDKIRKHGAEEFGANVDDDPKKAKFWLENTIRVFDELFCIPAECLKCAISLLRDSACQWWNTLVSVVLRDRVTWEFFQTEFQKKYISQRFLDQKHKEFLELK
ncbi:Protein MCM10 [Gossypium australe]|uniref:Protein MCM10 n=1 Tax=Gossypium australe TaxID=47621 RepID=A0A5B6VXR8_9ROSI|nr:Protein MCM10 [Gossypium australe]